MTTALKATAALTDAQAAAEAEGLFAPTADQKKLLRRLADLKRRSDAIAVEDKAIRKTIADQMDEIGARGLTVNGKNVVLLVPVSGTEFYADAMRAAHPDIVEAYETAKAAYDEAAKAFTYKISGKTQRREFRV